MNHPERTPDPIAEILRNASKLSDDDQLKARAAFMSRVDSMLRNAENSGAKSAGSRTKRWIAPMALAAAVLLAIYIGWPAEGLNYQVTGAANDGGYIRATATESVHIRFTDNTVVTAEPKTRVRVVELQERGARLSLEEGTLHVHVTHKDQSAWQFGAGPFQVHVTGTRFDLSWDAAREQLAVTLHEGSVNVEGYSGSGPVEVRAGQSFLGDARSRTMQVRDTKAQFAAASGPSSVDSASALPGSNNTVDETSSVVDETSPLVEAPPPAVKAPPTPTAPLQANAWTHFVSQGDFKKVVTEAKRRGFSTCISNCSVQDLSALADAARYTGQTDLAEKCLLSLQTRFASSAGNRATFLLGRLYEGQGKSNKALGFYQTALKQSPNGPFAPESLAGKMRMTSAVQGKVAAAPIAREYLIRYPSGVHVGTARQLTELP